MKWLTNIFHKEINEGLRFVQGKFANFLTILEENNQVLATISDMEEKSQGEYLFDINYIRSSLDRLKSGVQNIIDEMVSLGGENYAALRERFSAIFEEIEAILQGSCPIEKDEFTIPFEKLCRDQKFSVGSKNAQLGEMKSRLNLPVPDGFAISAWAYKQFVNENNLQEEISRRIESIDLQRYEDLERVSAEIRELIKASAIPSSIAEAIRSSCRELEEKSPDRRFALRSSAIGEDTLLSFAGQYATYLNVSGCDILDRYLDIIASKFSPKAIYYFLSHSLAESDLAMSVGCVAMVDARSSGVIYTRDPVNPDDKCLVIYSIFGLGKYLVDGTLTPDYFRISREDSSIIEHRIAKKNRRLVLSKDGDTIDEPVASVEQNQPAISENEIKKLTDFALKVEEHYGFPQDIEWAIDRDGRPFLLQTRPLRVVKSARSSSEPDLSEFKVLVAGGVTACPGAGAGPVCHVSSSSDLPDVPDGAVLVATNPFPGLITVMGKIAALVTEVGGVASHMATLARENRLPTIVGLNGAKQLLSPEQMVTVDATAATIYDGAHRELIGARRPENLFNDTPIFKVLEQLLLKISPLSLLNPDHEDFKPENCRTLHDITRFTHQKAMEEMFSGAEQMEQKDKYGCRLKSDIPLQVNVVSIDGEKGKSKRWLAEDDIASIPMRAFWGGVKKEGWPSYTPPSDAKGFISVLATAMTRPDRPEFSENSFAILSREYMVVSLRMGYHFSTVEAMCTDAPGKNYIRMQYKEGGASLDRRIRRVQLITEILKKMGFENSSKRDFLYALIAYQTREAIEEKLHLLGRITIMTKQLDMALSNDAVAQWYLTDFLKRLGLAGAEGSS